MTQAQRDRITGMLEYKNSYVESFAGNAAWIWNNMPEQRAWLISKAWGHALDADALTALLAATETSSVKVPRARSAPRAARRPERRAEQLQVALAALVSVCENEADWCSDEDCGCAFSIALAKARATLSQPRPGDDK